MNYGRCFSDYQEELELAWIQNSAVECELYSIVASVIRESESGKGISLRDVSTRRTTENSKYLKGDSGFPDFVVLERSKSKNAKKYGCIEIKRPEISIDETSDLQLRGHIKSFGKVIYTNGLLWIFYDKSDSAVWKCELGKIVDESFKWERVNKWHELLGNLDEIEWSKE